MEQRNGSCRYSISSDEFFTVWNYKHIQEGSNIAKRYSEACADVFNTGGEGEWNYNYPRDRAQKLLERDLRRKEVKIRLITMEDKNNVIHGFIYGFIINVDRLGPTETPYHWDKTEKKKVIEKVKIELNKKIGKEKVFFFGPLGIVQQSRKGNPLRLQMLVSPMLAEIEKDGVKYLFFFTSRDSNIYTFCKFMEVEELHRIEDDKKIVFLLLNTDFLSYATGRWKLKKDNNKTPVMDDS